MVVVVVVVVFCCFLFVVVCLFGVAAVMCQGVDFTVDLGLLRVGGPDAWALVCLAVVSCCSTSVVF